MSDFRKERIENLAYELSYELRRALHEGELESEYIYFNKVIGYSKEVPASMVLMRLIVRPERTESIDPDAELRLVK